MAKPIQLSPNEFASAVNAILAEYKDIVDADLEYVTNKVAREAVESVKSNINREHIKGKKYRNSIRSRSLSEGIRGKYSSLVYANPPHYRLTHLLEHGHAVVLKGGRKPAAGKKNSVDAFPHWAEAEQKAIRDFEELLRRELE